MKKLVLIVVLAISMTGCCALSESDEALVREIRKTLVESTRPTLAEALHRAKGDSGGPWLIEPLRDERVNTVDAMIESIDRVYPPVDGSTYERETLPWKE